jgi:HEAT repeat protein
MAYTLPIVPDTIFTERQGVHYVGLVASKMGLVWREAANTDLGIDGYLEAVVNGAPIGLIAVQVKSGQSYIESPNNINFIFRAEGKHVRYWLSYRLPVIVIVYDPESQVAYWHYITDYIREHPEGPPITDSVPIRISKSVLFDETAKERLQEIAARPDSTAHAMLALRASRYNHTYELLTPTEMMELYGKRGWLGSWLPLDKEREEILLHSLLAGRGPAWYWFRAGTNRDYVPHLKSALQHPDFYLCSESSIALASAIGREAVEDVRTLLHRALLNEGDNAIEVSTVLASIPDLAYDDRMHIINDLWSYLNDQSDAGKLVKGQILKFLSVIAQIGGGEVREQVVSGYVSILAGWDLTRSTVPPLLRTAGHLWRKDELPELRKLLDSSQSTIKALAVTALAQIGERQDLEPVIEYIISADWKHEDLWWLSNEAARLFRAEDLVRLQQMLRTNDIRAHIAHCVLPQLCQSLNEDTLLMMIENSEPAVQAYAVRGLISIRKTKSLREYEHLVNSDESLLRTAIAKGLTASGDWETIDELLKSETDGLRAAVAEGLRHVKEGPVLDRLLDLIDDEEAYLAASESIEMRGDEEALQKIVNRLTENPHAPKADLLTDIVIHLDHRLYCPFQLLLNRRRDFSSVRHSVTRYDQDRFIKSDHTLHQV